MGGFKVQRDEDRLLADARDVQDAGAFSVILEGIPSDISEKITNALSIPTIGIGAGPHCDGQVLVYHDLLGLEDRLNPKFVRQYADLGERTREAVRRFADDVRSGDYPTLEESYDDPSTEHIRKIYG